MEWLEVIENPLLRDLPFKIELNQWGKILMSPASNEHGIYQALLVEWFIRLAHDGKSITECSVQTSCGVKVADVAWASYKFFKCNGRANPYLQSPEIVVEIISPSNTTKEMDEKKELYFARGAVEFWICNSEGTISFFNNIKLLENSQLIPNFPNKIEIDFA